MPDFYASPSGNDSNSGTAASPFRSITRATAAAVTSGGSGILHAADGSYDYGSGERFPITVPPGYTLQGQSRGGTTVEFRTPSSGRGIAAIESGNGVSHLTLRAGDPIPGGGGATCTHGIFVTTDDATIERVRILPSRSLPPYGTTFPPAPWPADVGAFYSAISTGAARRTLIRDCVVEWHWMWIGGNVTIRSSRFLDSNIMLDSGSVFGSTFDGSGIGFRTSSLWVAINDGITIRGNTFHRSFGIEVDAVNFPVRLGPGPLIESNMFDNTWIGIGFQGTGATARVNGTTMTEVQRYGVSVGAGTPVIRGNTFETSSTSPYMELVSSGLLARPVFEGNVLRHPPPPPGERRGSFSAEIRGAADFGGGGSSSGGNDFSAAQIIYCGAPGAEIFLRSNIWRDPADPNQQIHAYPGTIIRV